MDETVIFADSTRRALQQRLLAWYSAEAIPLPWRGTRDLYRIWVSEIMLQQTQVATVIGYYERFLTRFPDVHALAEAPEHDVLRVWEGLGYYRRARQIHAAAKKIAVEHDGEFPTTLPNVLALPGIGRYTAGAILSIGRDLPLPILEANTIRLLSRLTAFRGDPASTDGQKHLWSAAAELLPASQVGDFNQALMDLGRTVCTPRTPRCLLCPLKSLCPTRKAGLQEKIPAAKKQPQFEEVTEAAVVLRRPDGRVLLRLSTPGQRWAGMWDFPRFRLEAASRAKRNKQIAESLLRLTGQKATAFSQLAIVKHGVTRFRITLHVMEARLERVSRAMPRDTQFLWRRPAQLGELALSMTGRKIAKMLGERESTVQIDRLT